MKKKILLLMIGMFSFGLLKAQIGIYTESPFSTLHVMKNPNGTVADGIIAPHLTLSELQARNTVYTTNQTGAFVYVTDIDVATTLETANVSTIGYYYFDGAVWKHFNDRMQTADNGLTPVTSSNIQLGGDLLKNTTIDVKEKKLTIQNTGGTGFGLQLPGGNPVVGQLLQSKDTGGIVIWGPEGKSRFARIPGQTSPQLSYTTTSTFMVVYSGLSIDLVDPGTYLVTIGMRVLNMPFSCAVQLMPTNNPANWESRIYRFLGSFEAYSHIDIGRIYYSQVITVEPGSTVAYLMIAVIKPTYNGNFSILWGENASAAQPQVSGGSYLRIN